MKNNPVFQVLVVTNPTILAAANEVSDLAVGQLGIFDVATNQSVAHNAALPAKFYFAAGLPDLQTGLMTDIRKSAGEYIEKSILNRVDSSEYVAPAQQVVTLALTGLVPQYGTDYVVRFSFQSGQTMNLNGFQNPVKSWTISTPTTDTGDMVLATFIDLVVAEINLDEEALIVAANVSDVSISFTVGSEDKEYLINGINKRYNALREFKVEPAFGGGFEDLAWTVTETGPTYEQGSGYDVQQLEYTAGGWIGNPGSYRDSNLNGVLAAPIITQSVAGTNYWLMRYNYLRNYTSGGSLAYDSVLETVLAVPQTAANFTLINQLITMVNAYLPNEGDTTAITTTTTTSTTTTTTTTV